MEVTKIPEDMAKVMLQIKQVCGDDHEGVLDIVDGPHTAGQFNSFIVAISC